MEDNKVAAGRKMLMQFQKKKAGKKHVESDTNGTYHSETLPTAIESYTTSISDLSNKTEVNYGTQYSESIFEPISSQSPDMFFEEFSNTNRNIHQSNVAISNDNDIPLAGMLFSPQNNGQDDFGFLQQSSIPNTEMFYANNSPIPENINIKQNVPMQHTTSESVEYEGVPDIRSLVEISKLQQQLQFHIKTVEFLVSEKNSLSEKVNHCEKTVDELKNQNADLTGRLNISRHRVSHLEIECSQLKQKNEAAEKQIKILLNESANSLSMESVYKKQLEEVQEELQEMKTLMDDKVSEYKMLLRKYEEVSIQLQSNELRLQQVIQGDGQGSANLNLQEHCHNLEQMVNSLRQQISQVESERNQSGIHYQQYVQQLNGQVQTLNEKQEELINENERLQNREDSLLHQMGELEKQLQTTFTRNVSQETPETNNKELEEKLQLLETERSQLQSELQTSKALLDAASQEINKKQEEIEEVTRNLQRIQSESPDVTKLNAAIESDRLAAQKATAQNAKMKDDLQHLEKAFEQMTNSKLELAELLQAEKNLSKNLTLKLVETEERLKEVESKLLAKDEEMIRLQAASSELEKEMLKHAQITDRINHYEAQGKSLESVQTELQSARSTIHTLTNENDKLRKISVQSNGNHSSCDGHKHNAEENTEQCTNNSSEESSETPLITMSIPTADAMNKLQEKFTKLIKEVADLSDEKQRLEHIVLQLQGETETICEYITLYQKQRSMLKQREAERISQLNTLSKEREHMKQQLEDLRGLVAQLNSKTDDKQVANNESAPVITKIMDLVSEIKSNHLIEPGNHDFETFHHCPWCSGKLITI